jgi:hypothetical protein
MKFPRRQFLLWERAASSAIVLDLVHPAGPGRRLLGKEWASIRPAKLPAGMSTRCVFFDCFKN